MPRITYPNQREINIHRERAASNFLGIKNDNWMAASRALGAHALRLYLYLASNADGYRLALSPAAIQQQIGMPTSTYRDQFRKLESMHYIKYSHGNTYDFYERPYDAAYPPKDEKEESAAPVLSFEDAAVAADYEELPVDYLMAEDREINNLNTKTMIQQILRPPQAVSVLPRGQISYGLTIGMNTQNGLINCLQKKRSRK